MTTHRTRDELLQDVERLERRVAELEAAVAPPSAPTAPPQAVLDKLRDVECELESLYGSAPVILLNVDMNGRVGKANRLAAGACGRSAEDMVGMSVGEAIRCERCLTDPADCGFGPGCSQCVAGETVRDTLRTGTPHDRVEAAIRVVVEGRPEEKVFLVSTARGVLNGEAGVTMVLDDITERKRVEDALRESKRMLDATGRMGRIGGWQHDLKTGKAVWTEALYDIGKFPRDGEPPGVEEHLSYYPPRERERLQRAYERSVSEGIPFDLELQGRTADGESRWWRAQGEPVYEEGECVAMRGTFQDITDRRQAQEALRDSERKFRLVTETIRDVFWMSTPGVGEMVYISPAYEEVWGRSRASLHAHPRSFLDGVHPADRPLVEQGLEQYHERGLPYTVEYRVRRPDGSVRWVHERGYPVPDETGVVTLMTGVCTDVTEHRLADAALQEAEARYRMIFEGTCEGILVAEMDTARITYANQEACAMLGYTAEDLMQLTVADLHPLNERERFLGYFREQTLGGPTSVAQAPYLRKDGSVMYADINTAVAEVGGRQWALAFLTDATERRHLEEELRQTQKMESVGRLAGGIAHDFNNLLTGMRGLVGFAREDAEPGTQGFQDLTETLDLIERAASLTRQLLAFSRRQALEPVAFVMNDLVAEQFKMLRRLLGEDIDIRFVPGQELGSVRADRGQIEQVIMNLAVNARDAMPAGGQLTIETANVDLGEQNSRQNRPVSPGPYVMLAVSDTGSGMDEATQADIFEPFFTTKELGKGTGLGLSTVYGIVKQHGGNVWVYSEPGRGTTFKIYLPRVRDEAAESVIQPWEIVGGTETILLVEDNDAVRAISRRLLDALGYTVLCAASAAEARKVAWSHDGSIDLLLTDVVMPDENGYELYESLAARQPDLKVLFASGYTDSTIMLHGVESDGMAFLQKPFEREELAAKVREALQS